MMRRRAIQSRAAYRGIPILAPSILFLFLLLLASCGGEEATPDENASTLPFEQTTLVLAVSPSASAVEAAGAGWARREGVALEAVTLEPPPEETPSLVEVRGPGEAAWLLEPRALLVRLDALEEIGRGDTPPASWPELSALVLDLGRAGGGLGLPAEREGLHELLLPLIWSALPDSVALEAGSALAAPVAEEALAFLVQLAQHSLRLPASERDEAFLSGQIAILPCGLDQARRLQASMPSLRLRLWPWPAAPDSGEPRSLALLRSLVVPPGAPHVDLARSLARELAGPDASTAVAAGEEACVPADSRASYELALLPASSRRALRAWPLSSEEAAEAELLDEACDAALDLRRSPGDALAEARRRSPR